MTILIVLILLLLAYAELIRPNLPKRDVTPLMGRDYAHRGLWTTNEPGEENRPENSLAAFRAAVEKAPFLSSPSPCFRCIICPGVVLCKVIFTYPAIFCPKSATRFPAISLKSFPENRSFSLTGTPSVLIISASVWSFEIVALNHSQGVIRAS